MTESILSDIEEQHLINTDIMIIDMDSIGHEGNRNKLRNYLVEKRLIGKASYSFAGAASPEDFFRSESDPPSIVYSSINRAKGNEAYQVYIINAQKVRQYSSVMRDRNALLLQ